MRLDWRECRLVVMISDDQPCKRDGNPARSLVERQRYSQVSEHSQIGPDYWKLIHGDRDHLLEQSDEEPRL